MNSTMFGVVVSIPILALLPMSATAQGMAATESDARIGFEGAGDPCISFTDPQHDGPRAPSTSAMASYAYLPPCSGQANGLARSDLTSFTLRGSANAQADGVSILRSYASGGAELNDVLNFTGFLQAPAMVTLRVVVSGTITGPGLGNYCFIFNGAQCDSFSQEGQYSVPVASSLPVFPGPPEMPVLPPRVGFGITVGAVADTTSLPINSDFSASCVSICQRA